MLTPNSSQRNVYCKLTSAYLCSYAADDGEGSDEDSELHFEWLKLTMMILLLVCWLI